MKKINILFVIVIFSVLSSFGRSAYVCSDSIKARWFEITEIIDHGVMSEIFATPIFPNGDHAVNAQIIVERTSTASLDSLCGWIKLQPGDLCKLDIYFPYSRPDENGFFVEGMHGLIKHVY